MLREFNAEARLLTLGHIISYIARSNMIEGYATTIPIPVGAARSSSHLRLRETNVAFMNHPLMHNVEFFRSFMDLPPRVIGYQLDNHNRRAQDRCFLCCNTLENPRAFSKSGIDCGYRIGAAMAQKRSGAKSSNLSSRLTGLRLYRLSKYDGNNPPSSLHLLVQTSSCIWHV